MRRSRGGYRKRGNIHVLLVIALAFTLIYLLAAPTQKYFSQRAQINSLKSQINANQKALNEAQQELTQWNNPEYVKSQARARLHFVMPGERKYMVSGIDNLDSNPETHKIAKGATVGVPWYTRLISSITETSK